MYVVPPSPYESNISTDQEVFVELPEVPVTVGQNTNVFAKIVSINGTAITDEQKTATIKKDAPKEGNGDKLKIIIKTDQYAYECAMTQARGSFTLEFVRYEEVPKAAQAKIIEEAKNED